MTTRVSRLFVDQDIGVGHDLQLSGQACHYLRNVLRLRQGDAVILFNGQGGEYRAGIARLDRDRATLDIIGHDAVERESALPIELGLAVIKPDAMNYALRKATELGATRIVPLLSDFTTVAHRQARGRHDHWVEITRSACEQCGRNQPPLLASLADLNDWLVSDTAAMRLMADPSATANLDEIEQSPASVRLLSGPEGGFSDKELEHARASGFQAFSLGPRILRADTAPLAALALIQHKWGDL